MHQYSETFLRYFIGNVNYLAWPGPSPLALIEFVAAELDNLRRLGLWLSDELVDLFLEEAGEK